MIRNCVRQLRVGMGGAFGLDFGAVLAMGEAMGADRQMLAEVLPEVEACALGALARDDDEVTDGED